MIDRHEQWVEKLDGSLLAHRAKPFAWGEHDCALSVCNHVLAMTGVDLAAEFRGKYGSEAEALAIIQKLYPSSPAPATLSAAVEHLAEALTAKHELSELKPLFAQRGDIVLLDTPQGTVLGLVTLDGQHVAVTGPKGLHRLGLRNVRRAWRVGRLSHNAKLGEAPVIPKPTVILKTAPPATPENLTPVKKSSS